MTAVHEQAHERTGEQDQPGQPAEQAGQMDTVFEGEEDEVGIRKRHVDSSMNRRYP